VWLLNVDFAPRVGERIVRPKTKLEINREGILAMSCHQCVTPGAPICGPHPEKEAGPASDFCRDYELERLDAQRIIQRT